MDATMSVITLSSLSTACTRRLWGTDEQAVGTITHTDRFWLMRDVTGVQQEEATILRL